tara:strand:- start:107 stop:541 length:435 start_codon:yes stop_codon:yes gene_type:complete
MPRGNVAKANKAHNKAMLRGNSCQGSAMTAESQKNGKKYNKGESKNECEYCIKKLIYNGTEYSVSYKFDGITIHLLGVSKGECLVISMTKQLQYQIVYENLTALTNHALKYDKITIADYISMVQKEYIIGDKILLKKKLTKMIN